MKTKHLKNLCKRLCASVDGWRFVDGERESKIQMRYTVYGYDNVYGWYDVIHSSMHSKNRRYADLLMKFGEVIRGDDGRSWPRFSGFPSFSSLEELELKMEVMGI